MHAEPQARAALHALRGAEYLTLSVEAKLRLLRALGEAYLDYPLPLPLPLPLTLTLTLILTLIPTLIPTLTRTLTLTR